MDIRIHRTPLQRRLNAVERTKRVRPAQQDEPEQDKQSFSEHLNVAGKQKKDQQEETADQEQNVDEQRNQQEESEGRDESEEQKRLKGESDDQVGGNIDIKI